MTCDATERAKTREARTTNCAESELALWGPLHRVPHLSPDPRLDFPARKISSSGHRYIVSGGRQRRFALIGSMEGEDLGSRGQCYNALKSILNVSQV